MKRSRLKTLVEAAAKLPPAKGRALLRAVAAKDAPDDREAFAEAYLAQAAEAMAAAMEAALVKSLAETIS